MPPQQQIETNNTNTIAFYLKLFQTFKLLNSLCFGKFNLLGLECIHICFLFQDTVFLLLNQESILKSFNAAFSDGSTKA